MFNKILTAILSTIVFSSLFALFSYTFDSQKNTDVLYFSYLDTLMFTMLYTGVIYLLVTVPVSIGIEYMMNKIEFLKNKKTYLLHLLFYSTASCIFGMLFYQIINVGFPFSKEAFFNSILISFIAANIFYHLYLVVIKFRTTRIKTI